VIVHLKIVALDIYRYLEYSQKKSMKVWVIIRLNTKSTNEESMSETNRYLQNSAPKKTEYKIFRQRELMTFLVSVKQTIICKRVPPKKLNTKSSDKDSQ
jgi:hypothetical protein